MKENRNIIKYNAYQKKYQLNRYYKRRQQALDLLGGKCIVCGSKEKLEFDHINAKDKNFAISKLWSISQKRFDEEINKCQILCHEHHLIKTKLYGDNTGGGHNRIDNYNHGTGHMYRKDKCRCIQCSEWRRNYELKLVDYFGNLRS